MVRLQVARVAPRGPARPASTSKHSAAHEAVVLSGAADLALLIARLTIGPAKALGLAAGTLRAGAEADLVVLDPKAKWTPSAKTLFSKSGNNPLTGRPLTGRVLATFVGGHQVHGA